MDGEYPARKNRPKFQACRLEKSWMFSIVRAVGFGKDHARWFDIFQTLSIVLQEHQMLVAHLHDNEHTPTLTDPAAFTYLFDDLSHFLEINLRWFGVDVQVQRMEDPFMIGIVTRLPFVSGVTAYIEAM